MKNAEIAAMETKMSKVAGAAVELTIRAERAFTFSFESVNEEAAAKLAKFFEGQAKVEVEHDEECGSFVYVDCK
ncbi:hypothetical protein PM404_gp45 [Stenotrophomonas phage vB_SmaS-DLP_1]|jgi:hypothetical protein|uniref:Uncharacterized protein n=2 Tax=Septimatrevirus TaxID=1921544 RepID=A0A0M3MWN3_9CAUD|nr:hypothetical protein PM404_gp45 [Stenotrophomonas phage vB_SmaS-DLP_1]AKI28834.1 hypothetical protein [Stenotrophomonas phage vB_SmaS-DLP_1]